MAWSSRLRAPWRCIQLRIVPSWLGLPATHQSLQCVPASAVRNRSKRLRISNRRISLPCSPQQGFLVRVVSAYVTTAYGVVDNRQAVQHWMLSRPSAGHPRELMISGLARVRSTDRSTEDHARRAISTGAFPGWLRAGRAAAVAARACREREWPHARRALWTRADRAAGASGSCGRRRGP